MTSARDVHDMLGITADPSSRLKAKKKGKPSTKRPDGMAREVFSLLGERAPPVPLAEPTLYKAKPKAKTTSNIRWRDAPFHVTVRGDGLLLRHWKRDMEAVLPALDADTVAMPPPPIVEADVDMDDPLRKSREKTMARLEQNVKDRVARSQEMPTEETYKWDKLNVPLPTPEYDDEIYEKHLTSDDWSKEETDYLLNLYAEYYGKWHVLWDRYEFTPSMAQDPDSSFTPPERSIEDLKARFYAVSAKAMAAKTPLQQMTATEFANHEKMTKYDAEQDKERKRQLASLMSRSKAEREEEKLLLIELQRIFNRRHQLEAEGRELRNRLDHSLTDDTPGATLYTSSGEINTLLQKMLHKERTMKMIQQQQQSQHRGMMQSPSNAHSNQGHSGQIGKDMKRSSLAAGGTPARHNLGPAGERRFGIKSVDKPQTGVTFKSDRCTRARVAKSTAKTEKIAMVLGELGIPDVLQMPTDEVIRQVELLSTRIGDLIDRRRLLEKEENELRIEREKKMIANGERVPADGEQAQAQGQDEDEEDAAGEIDDDAQGEPEDEDAQGALDEGADMGEDGGEDADGEREEDGEFAELEEEQEESDAQQEDMEDVEEEDEDEEEEEEEEEEDEDDDGVNPDEDDEGENQGSSVPASSRSRSQTHQTTRSHKRSISVLSAASGRSQAELSSKRRKV